MVFVDDFNKQPYGDGGLATKIQDLNFRALLLLLSTPYGSS